MAQQTVDDFSEWSESRPVAGLSRGRRWHSAFLQSVCMPVIAASGMRFGDWLSGIHYLDCHICSFADFHRIGLAADDDLALVVAAHQFALFSGK